MNKKTTSSVDKRTPKQKELDAILDTLTSVETRQVLDVLNWLFLASDLPDSRRGTYFGNRHSKVAAYERICKTGFDETNRILKIYHDATKRGEPYRPGYSTPTAALTTSWHKFVSFADSVSRKNKGSLAINDNDLRDEIARGLAKDT